MRQLIVSSLIALNVLACGGGSGGGGSGSIGDIGSEGDCAAVWRVFGTIMFPYQEVRYLTESSDEGETEVKTRESGYKVKSREEDRIVVDYSGQEITFEKASVIKNCEEANSKPNSDKPRSPREEPQWEDVKEDLGVQTITVPAGDFEVRAEKTTRKSKADGSVVSVQTSYHSTKYVPVFEYKGHSLPMPLKVKDETNYPPKRYGKLFEREILTKFVP